MKYYSSTIALLVPHLRDCLLVIAFCLLITSCSENNKSPKVNDKDTTTVIYQKNKTDDFLITDSSFGRINRVTTYSDLQSLFGNVTDTISYGAEGMDSFTVTKIYSNTTKEVVINWQPDKLHKEIASVDCFRQGSPYHTKDTLSVGSTLEKLLAANGKKINFYGTGWDYGGIITSYNKGRFDKSNIFFQLDAKEGAGTAMMGDHELNTDMPSVKKNLQKLFISKISLSFSK